ncbi:hypothetical protein STRTUCAR8_03659 [Streptomyces turgidiscabies Car8]|uniref:Uncharacterized protein n=1 Tax=Streptomyces turgidiscabies (strain Car8) TaxID=698760 RepID=L7ERH6_STRT8|nr:hypothetical protein STRTUCAR8_03659 [Streptomyces turgidiscabies Car8]
MPALSVAASQPGLPGDDRQLLLLQAQLIDTRSPRRLGAGPRAVSASTHGLRTSLVHHQYVGHRRRVHAS